MNRRTFVARAAAGAVAAGLPLAARAQPPKTLKVGILGDMSGPFSSSDGPGCAAAGKLAAADMAALLPGTKIEVLIGDHTNKPDVGSSIAREWFDRDEVAVIADLGNSSIALAVSQLAREHNRTALVTASGPLDLTGPSCNAQTILWTFDTWSLTNAVTQPIIKNGGKSWFFIAVDYTFGRSLTEQASARVEAAGGKVAGVVKYPLGTTDFSSQLVQAQSSGANVLALANGGQDTANSVKQAKEFGLDKSGMTIVPLISTIADIHALGLQAGQGLLLASPFYWDRGQGTRDWSKRFMPIYGGDRVPTMMHAGTYSALMHWARCVAQGAPVMDGAATVRSMKALPTDDALFGPGRVRQDGRKLHPMYMFKVKSPAESKRPWDYYTQVDMIPAEEAFRPMANGGCPLVTG
jgi:branched-chain amino acid transport system substrate-binding protein